MSSPITFGGFNNIDFNAVLNILMTQEALPRESVATQQTALTAQSNVLATLSTKLAAVASASSALSDATAASRRQATSTDDAIVSASADADGVLGAYEIVVSELAHSQVTASATQYDDTDETIVANGGILTIGDVDVDITGESLTLEGLADAINATENIGVSATIVSPSSGKYQLVLTGIDTGADNAFIIIDTTLTLDSAPLTAMFDGAARTAADAELTVNNVAIRSATNTVDGAVPGTTLTLHGTSAETVTVSVSRDADATTSLVQTFVDAYNSLVTMIQQQDSAQSSASRDPMLRAMYSQLRSALTARYEAGGAESSLFLVGVGFERSGKLSVDATALANALSTNEVDVGHLFGGDGVLDGVFGAVESLIDGYVASDGLIANSRTRITELVARMDQQLADMDERLATRRLALQKEFTAADSLMSQLNSSTGSLTSLSSQYRLF
jgi:flagellar hook-associated protein 2